jgi:hypothetical protein
VIDRRKYTDRAQRNGKHRKARRQTHSCGRNTGPEEINRHHVAAAPVIGDPAAWERQQPEHCEARPGQLQQVAILAAVEGLKSKYDGRVDQKHIMVEQMAPIQKANRAGSVTCVIRRYAFVHCRHTDSFRDSTFI